MVGQHGLKESILEEVHTALDAHELIKVKLAVGDRDERQSLIEQIVNACGAELIQTIGHMAVLFRRNTKKPKIALPGK